MDFVAEGMDQTRGWFYTMHAIATVVFNQNAFHNIIANGIILDSEGRKMSKSLGNTIDPWSIFNLQGSDALRWLYYISGPPHKEKRLSIENVRHVVSQFIVKYWNSFLLFSNNSKENKIEPNLNFNPKKLKNPLDKWIISRINTLVKKVKQLLDDYLIYHSANEIQLFIINELSNWYLRLARKRFLDKEQDIYNIVYYVFDILNRLMAPFVPFLTEKVFLQMQKDFNYMKKVKSIHLLDFPSSDEKLIDELILKEMDFVINLTQDLRALREQVKIKIRQPIKEYLFYLKEEQKLIVKKYESLIKSELNVKNLKFIGKHEAKSLYSEELYLNKGVIGRDFKKERVNVEKILNSMDINDIKRDIFKGKLAIKLNDIEYEITKEHFQIKQHAKNPYAVKISSYGTILINSKLDNELLREGFAREFIRNIQNIRKKLNLSRFKEYIEINILSDIDIEKEFGVFIEIVKKETSCVKIGKDKIGKSFSFKIQNKTINLLINIKNS